MIIDQSIQSCICNDERGREGAVSKTLSNSREFRRDEKKRWSVWVSFLSCLSTKILVNKIDREKKLVLRSYYTKELYKHKKSTFFRP